MTSLSNYYKTILDFYVIKQVVVSTTINKLKLLWTSGSQPFSSATQLRLKTLCTRTAATQQNRHTHKKKKKKQNFYCTTFTAISLQQFLNSWLNINALDSLHQARSQKSALGGGGGGGSVLEVWGWSLQCSKMF